MKTIVKKAALGLALGATAIGMTAAPAQAQRYRHYHHHGDTTGAALLGGVIGLGVGAAIASSNNDRYYDRGYYNNGYYDNGYYARPGYYAPRRVYRERCWTQYRYDPYYGGDVPVQVCR
jgi:fatty acid desaturase